MSDMEQDLQIFLVSSSDFNFESNLTGNLTHGININETNGDHSIWFT